MFHDSFRQFVIAHTNLDDSVPQTNPAWDAHYHAAIADRCATAARQELRWEELYHRHRAGQDVAPLASQLQFRDQTIALRSPEAIREDLGIVFEDAALRRDLLGFTWALLAKVEFEARLSALEQTDVSGTYLHAGMPDEAVAFSGVDQRRLIPLSHAYRLAAQLGFAGNPHGQRVFAAIDGSGFEDDTVNTSAHSETGVYEAWAAAAALYRPLPQVLAVLRSNWPGPGDDGDDEHPRFRNNRPSVNRFRLMARQICSALIRTGRTDQLNQVEDVLGDLYGTVDANDETAGHRHATLLDIRLAIVRHRAERADNEADANELLHAGLGLTVGPMYDWNLFDWAHIALDLGGTAAAAELISRRPLDEELRTSDVGFQPDVSLRTRYDYWRARHRIHRRTNSDDAEAILEPARPDEPEPAPSWQDRNAVALTARIDKAIRTLAAAAAATNEGTPYDTGRLWTDLVPNLAIGHRPPSTSATYDGVRGNTKDLLDLVIDTAAAHSASALQQLADRFGSRFSEEPHQWYVASRLRLAARFTKHGHTPIWYRDAIAAEEAALPHSDHDISGRLDTTAELVEHYRRVGQLDDARRLARTLVPMSFGVGFRKDYQFERWTELFDRAVTDGLPDPVEHATYLARLLRVAGPMTEGAPRESAAKLLRTLGGHTPGPGVALFEYLVRHGAVDHLDALGELLTGLVRTLDDAASLTMCVDLITDVLAAADQHSHPDAARAVADACSRLPADQRDSLLTVMRERLERYPLPTTRLTWLDAIGVQVDSPDIDGSDRPSDSSYGHLHLDDDRVLTRAEVAGAVQTASDAIELRRHETANSSFNWIPVIDRLDLGDNDLETLTRLFNPSAEAVWADRHDADVLVLLGQRWLDRGRSDRAADCATRALAGASEDSWTRYWGITRRDAHQLAIAAGGEAELHRAWNDLATCVGKRPWRAEMLLNALEEIGAMLDATVSPVELWPIVRTHLDGMTLGIDVDDEDPMEHQPVRWWINAPSRNIIRVTAATTAVDALGALVVDHATHPAWQLRDSAIATASTNITTPASPVSAAIATLVSDEAPEDIVETLARIASFGEPTSDNTVKAIHDQLGSTENAYIRDLSAYPTQDRRPLPGRYQLAVPPVSGGTILGGAGAELWPFEDLVGRLAELAELDPDQLLGHVHSAMRQHRADYPSNGEVRDAFAGADLKLMWASPSTFIARTVVGRLIRDFEAAGYLDDLQPRDHRMLTSFDPALVHMRPGPRPTLMPVAPKTGHEPTLADWIEQTGGRLDEYLAALGCTDGLVVAARTRTTVLNWGHLEEAFTSITSVGAPPDPLEARHADPTQIVDVRLGQLAEPIPSRPLEHGHLLAVENQAWRFHQLRARWLSFSPVAAAALGWTPARGAPGIWETASGETAVETIRWVDGWWGQAGPAFDDTEGDGEIVLASAAGVAELRAAAPAIGRVRRLVRNGRESDSGEGIAAEETAMFSDLVEFANGNQGSA